MRDFPQTLKDWRHNRRLSQLQLASDAGVSPRHVAFLETGRARPSRGMVLRLADVLGLPHADQNLLLTAAGFSPRYPTLALDAAEMAQVRDAMEWTISRHAPYPAMILDRLWRITALNQPARTIFGPVGFTVGASLLEATSDPRLFSALIENWAEVGYHTALRLRAESAAAGGLAALEQAAANLTALPEIAEFRPTTSARAVLATQYRLGEARLSLFSTYAQFGSAEEVALAETKIELMFPADAETRAFLIALSE